jgi:hypothetical protein
VALRVQRRFAPPIPTNSKPLSLVPRDRGFDFGNEPFTMTPESAAAPPRFSPAARPPRAARGPL